MTLKQINWKDFLALLEDKAEHDLRTALRFGCYSVRTVWKRRKYHVLSHVDETKLTYTQDEMEESWFGKQIKAGHVALEIN